MPGPIAFLIAVVGAGFLYLAFVDFDSWWEARKLRREIELAEAKQRHPSSGNVRIVP